MCVFFRFRVVVGVYPYIISSIYRPAMTLASIDRRPSNRWKEGESASGAVKSCRSAHSRRDRRHTSPIKRRRSFSTSKCAGLTSRAARTERFVRTQPEEGGGKKEKKSTQFNGFGSAQGIAHKSFDDELLETLFSFDRAPCGLDVDK